jgi:hypothetical protein
LFGSVCRSTHFVLQSVSGEEQAHTPPVQTSPAAPQVVPSVLLEHVPRLHDWQLPLHAVLQQ